MATPAWAQNDEQAFIDRLGRYTQAGAEAWKAGEHEYLDYRRDLLVKYRETIRHRRKWDSQRADPVVLDWYAEQAIARLDKRREELEATQ